MSDSIPTITDQRLDLLVDGELPVDERRRLLVALDNEPDGWRRTALSFLEAQAWRGTLGDIVRSDVRGNGKSTSSVASPTQKDRSGAECDSTPVLRVTPWRPLALAAGLFFAFALGMIWRGEFHQDDRPNGPNAVVQSSNAPSKDLREPMIVQHIEQPLPERAATNGLPSSIPRGHVPPNDALMLVVGGDGNSNRRVLVPLVEASDLDQPIPLSQPSSMPDSFRRRLERSGYHVDTQRRYAPIPLQGGRRMYVPVEDTRIVPVNLTVY